MGSTQLAKCIIYARTQMDTGHFFGPASNPTHLRLTHDPTRLYKNAMRYAAVCFQKQYESTEALYHCSSMFNTRRNRRIHISYKSWTQYTRYVVKVQSHESSRQTDTCHCYTTHRRMPERTSADASISQPTDATAFPSPCGLPTKTHARIGPSSQTHTKNAWR